MEFIWQLNNFVPAHAQGRPRFSVSQKTSNPIKEFVDMEFIWQLNNFVPAHAQGRPRFSLIMNCKS